MQTTFALAALAAVAYAAPQGVTQDIPPSSPAPAGCSPSFDGEFEITIINSTIAKRDLIQRQSTCGTPGFLTIKLAGGQLTDVQGRTGYIAANYQFQFDAPAQTGAIFTGGFSVCSNGSLALGGSNVFYECLSGDFFNLYDRHWAAQCEPVLIDVLPCGTSGGATQAPDGQPAATTIGAPPVSQISDGQPQGQSAVPVSEFTDGQPQVVTAMPKPPVTQISDGQVQAPTGKPVTQISDGQVQAPTGKPVTQISDGQVQAPTGKPVTQISDGQVQAPTGKPVTQISDGQVQAPTGKPVTQISDGQVQAPTGKPVTQISDGQVQAPTGKPVTQISDGQVQAPTGKPVTQISDGQVQAPKTTQPAVVTQIPDGQIQAPNATSTSTPVPFTGAGNGLSVASSFAALIVGVAAVLLL